MIRTDRHYRAITILVVLLKLALMLALAPEGPAQAQTKPATKSSPASPDDPQLYRSAKFGFRFKIPYGWVDRTKEMQQGTEAGKTELLLAVFERPPEATGESINSAVVFGSESAASYPGLKKAEDYLGPLTEVATAKGFKAEGEPYMLDVESRQLFRVDFTKPVNDKLTMHQCTLVWLTKGQIISFTFIAGSDDQLDDLMDGLHFGAAAASPQQNSR